MKLAEALAERAEAQRRYFQLKERLSLVARVQEGEEPDENPVELLAEAEQLMDRLTWLIRRINATNTATAFDGENTLTDAIARRDAAFARRDLYADLAKAASTRQDRYSRSEIRYVSSMSVVELRKKMDEAAKEYRQWDTAIQQLNWSTDLIER
ncbi:MULTISPECIES: DIP1984 family protein [unclassified Corynebacterium]|uniref:DIP1984 family protein n=1 Tax=unclassified Corynebacterium TaxID=2624378 RepID=UPI0029CA9891|nr:MULTISPECIES: DIP1984 family protein [unclassified Corynebacterium]WPF66561.1 DIP1984 family protein [Corynebacterium sp. 22KM0430]WPF69050.1 DIP1984 family protein [Corynebacterium sp. 21KM1197]